ncbi:flagellar export chaperone FliS [Aliikangiella marina]|uniref:Flagellar secretion chaperone FliS n=1 Tax=Aliikangiella marina TaxID=1712262 RepID=A0A545TDM2_9GAMM|nr:flagellar export chaperone FliS [Aliikangiella marina]TQV75315.1 flagellar export chaperone FliS [Aliikangiella marina]
MSLHGLKQYQSTSTQSGIFEASPHRLIQMLFEGALEKIAKAKGFMQRNKIEEKGHHINWAIKIIAGLQNSLNMEQGGDLSEKLYRLYDYMIDTLMQAHAENSIEKLDEVTLLLKEVKSGWDGIEEEVRQMTNQQARSNLA